MRARHFLVLSILCFLFTAHVLAAGNPTIGKVGFLYGNWRLDQSRPGSYVQKYVVEKWSAAGQTMINLGYTVDGDSLVDYEMVVIREGGSHLLYEAHPMGQEPAVFRSVEMTDSSIVFENLEHDFPQRVGYARLGKESLLAWIEGRGKDGKTKRIEFPYESMK